MGSRNLSSQYKLTRLLEFSSSLVSEIRSEKSLFYIKLKAFHIYVFVCMLMIIMFYI
jgi:hypothetical protein